MLNVINYGEEAVFHLIDEDLDNALKTLTSTVNNNILKEKENMTFQMQAVERKELHCSECNETLLATETQYNILYEHSQQEYPDVNNLKHENVGYKFGFTGFKNNEPYKDTVEEAAGANYNSNMVKNNRALCKNNGKYIVLKKTLISATSF